jgi:hypothetical protein
VDATQKKSFKELQEITDKFTEFKKKNNLDEYFQMYLSPETRKNTLKLVDEMLLTEDDHWTDYLKEYKE